METKAFNKALSAFITSQKTQRDKLQVLLIAGLEQVETSGNTVYLSKALNACVGVRSLPTKAIKQYIQAHVSNCSWKKNSAGDMVFKKAIAKTPMEVTQPSQAWYEHESAAKAQASEDVDVIKAAELLLKRISKALEEQHVKAGQEGKARELLSGLNGALSA